MNKLVITSSAAVIMSLSLVGCNTMNSMNNGMNNVSQFGNKTIGTGVKYTAQTIGVGAGFIADTGAVVGKGIGSVANMGVGVVTSPFNYRGMKPAYNKSVVYHNGHRYVLRNGSYVLVR